VKRPPRALAATTAGEAIRAALELHGLADDVRGARVVTEWTELVGPRIAQRTRPDRIADRVLWVEVATAAWLRELDLLRPQLLRGLLERLGEPALFDDLRLRLAAGPRRDRVVVPRGRAAPPKPRPPVRPATGAAREAIVREVSAVDDEELRELIARVRITNDR
jgi:Dna[CI] antecedent, DciA